MSSGLVGQVKKVGDRVVALFKDGSSVGLVGQTIKEVSISSNWSQASPTQSTFYDVTDMTLTLEPGRWMLFASAFINVSQSSSANIAAPNLAIRTAANSLIASGIAGPTIGGNVTQVRGQVAIHRSVFISTATTYKLSMRWERHTGAAPTVSNLSVITDAGFYDSIPRFTAVKF